MSRQGKLKISAETARRTARREQAIQREVDRTDAARKARGRTHENQRPCRPVRAPIRPPSKRRRGFKNPAAPASRANPRRSGTRKHPGRAPLAWRLHFWIGGRNRASALPALPRLSLSYPYSALLAPKRLHSRSTPDTGNRPCKAHALAATGADRRARLQIHACRLSGLTNRDGDPYHNQQSKALGGRFLAPILAAFIFVR